jgi:V/A-type H+-transporting ATPase subunit E
MSIADITKKIIEEASEEAEKIIQNGKEEALKIEGDAGSLMSDIKEKHEKDLKNAISENERNVKSAAHREAKLRVEKARRDIMNKVYEDSLQRLNSLPKEKYEAVLKSVLGSLDKSVKGKIYCPKDRLKETNDAVSALGLEHDVAAKEVISGGIIFLGDNFEYDFTFEHLLKTQKDKIEIEVADILFS